MGFLRRLFGPKRAKDKKKRAAAAAAKPEIQAHSDSVFDANKHAIAVAAATAAVAEAALAAAHAAAEVVRLTNGAGASSASSAAAVTRSRCLAAVVIQSAFRGYLARRALRALKALVKLQALVRGNIMRKQTADMLRRMQTLVRVQARARASRTHLSESSKTSRKASLPSHPFPESGDRNGRQLSAHCIKYDGPSVLKRCGSNANFRDAVHKPEKPKTKATTGSNWLDRWMEESVWNDDDYDKSDKILEVDTWKPHLDPQRSTRSFQTPRNPGFGHFESPSKRSTSRPPEESPRAFSVSSRPSSSGGGGKRGQFSPAKSERSWGYFSAYSGYCPNYMANTESWRAKVRSQSAPRQRMELEKYGASKRSGQGYWDGWTHSGSNNNDADLRGSVVYPSFNNHLDRLGSASLR